MTKISNDTVYIVDTDLSDLDSLIGTDGNTTAKKTKNFLLGRLKSYFASGLSPLNGGVLRFTEITYSGDLYATNAEVLNSLDPIFVIEQYHVVVVNLNGEKSILKLQDRSVGIDLPLVLTTDFITINSSKNIVSSTLSIAESETEISINTPSSAIIPALYVNDLYKPTYEDFLAGNTKGTGTIAKPFTDTISYTTPTTFTVTANSSIQNALDSYVGTGGRGTVSSPANPEKLGQSIVIQNNNTSYLFLGTFDYHDLKLVIDTGTILYSNPTSWTLDMNSFSATKSTEINLLLNENSLLYLNKNGFKLVGCNSSVFNQKKFLNIKGTGELVLAGSLESYKLFQIDVNNLQYVNGNHGHLYVGCKLSTNRGVLIDMRGNSLAYIESKRVTILNDPASAVITNTNKVISTYNLASLNIVDSLVYYNNTPTVIYEEVVAMYDTSKLNILNSTFYGASNYFVKNYSALTKPTINIDFIKSYINTQFSLANTAGTMWDTIKMNNSLFTLTSINYSNTQLMPSSINYFKNQVVETLSTYASRAEAVIYGLTSGCSFINKKTVNAGSFLIGSEYKVTSLGTTDFTTIGASSNAVDTYFTSTGAGTGTGTASYYTRDTIL